MILTSNVNPANSAMPQEAYKSFVVNASHDRAIAMFVSLRVMKLGIILLTTIIALFVQPGITMAVPLRNPA